MDFLALAKKRSSVRSYLNKPVEQEKIDRILEAGRISPSACNKQPSYFLVVNETEGLEKLAKAARSHGAPAAIFINVKKDEAWVRPYDQKNGADVDAAIVTTQMMLEAENLGLNSCWIDYFKPDVIKKEFNYPAGLEPSHILVFGYGDAPDADPERHSEMRKPLTDLVSYQSY